MSPHARDWQAAVKAVKKRVENPTMLDVETSPEWREACVRNKIVDIRQIKV